RRRRHGASREGGAAEDPKPLLRPGGTAASVDDDDDEEKVLREATTVGREPAPPVERKDMPRGSLFVYLLMWVCVSLTVHSTSLEEVVLPASLVVVVVEVMKFGYAIVLFFIQKCEDEFTMREGALELCRLIAAPSKHLLPLLRAYAPIAALYMAVNVLSITNMRFFDPTTFVLLSSARPLITAVSWQAFFGRRISREKWNALWLISVGIVVKGLLDGSVSFRRGDDEHRQIAQDYIVHVLMLALQLGLAVCASLYNEKILKKGPTGVSDMTGRNGKQTHDLARNPHVQNMCLYFLGTVMSLCVFLYKHATSPVIPGGSIVDILGHLFHSPLTLSSSMLLAGAGVSTSLVLRYVDSIGISVASSLDPPLTAICSFLIFGYPITISTIISMIFVGSGGFIYTKHINSMAKESKGAEDT
ncbi:hypothetical protein ACHAWF_001388, partial [Thalassiosira exigua]